mmetsp:Transcript_4362/g.8737  ORF Transcript_4362/g.8737 Transcript_4362/m.8737 type:complete len:215 (-) Transcript_4362:219-863(-)|eukprot:CAMPEP_0172658492 /NCGR_PEP_ID=MMETSP1074-20121228/2818_1 /TAXON_ID=2916 /ORGANISM="Ceratium fusus, Strain PA161109" /LENGTH=214 /DNA_ID=CAMNT_0013473801 /DNA_START=42 /DNA_END=686 /DNA_ORIENTATION=-
MGALWPHGLAAVLAALLTVRTSCKTGLCKIGDCINCFYCDGECFSQCKCFGKINTCCCRSPPGYFSRGYSKVACPAGTYQDVQGGGACKQCDATEGQGATKYDITVVGAIDKIDCQFAQCSHTCKGDQTCEAQRCVFQGDDGISSPYTARLVGEMMEARPPRTDFCRRVGIPESGCTWLAAASSARGGWNDVRPFFGPVLVLATLARTLHEVRD